MKALAHCSVVVKKSKINVRNNWERNRKENGEYHYGSKFMISWHIEYCRKFWLLHLKKRYIRPGKGLEKVNKDDQRYGTPSVWATAKLSRMLQFAKGNKRQVYERATQSYEEAGSWLTRKQLCRKDLVVCLISCTSGWTIPVVEGGHPWRS